MTRQHDEDLAELELAPTEEELEAARALRDALDGRGQSPEGDLARAVRLAVQPTELAVPEHQAILNQALKKLPNRRRNVLIATFGAGASLAAAAAIALLVGKGAMLSPKSSDGRSATVAASLVRSRSTQALFDEPFPRHGGESARIDRIAQARARDYRANLFERMGVR